jgi:coenzyme PQQ precursor peptide PqqA
MRSRTAALAETIPRWSGRQRQPKEAIMKKWSDPAYCDIRLGFEVTAYVYVR